MIDRAWALCVFVGGVKPLVLSGSEDEEEDEKDEVLSDAKSMLDDSDTEDVADVDTVTTVPSRAKESTVRCECFAMYPCVVNMSGL